MTDLKIRQEKIQAKRKKTSFRDFVREVCSLKPIVFHKVNGLISRFSPQHPFKKIITSKAFEPERSNLTKSGIDYDHEVSFFENMKHLRSTVEMPNMVHYTTNENADFSDCVLSSKSAYLSSTVIRNCENVLYSIDVRYDSKDVLNSFYVLNYSSNVYSSVGIIQSYNIFYSKFINNCNNIWLSTNLTGCSECFLCDNLQNQSYCFQNKQYEKSVYLDMKKEFLNSKKNEYQKMFESLPNIGNNHNCSEVEGSFMIDCHNVENGHFGYNFSNGRNALVVGSEEENNGHYDCYSTGRATNFFAIQDGGKFSDNCYIGGCIVGCMNCFYCYHLEDCSYCLGCIGLKNKQFCILNKEYSKEERFELANKIFQKMNTEGTLGNFFPGSMNPFYFNDTAAYLIDDTFTKEEVTSQGYLWRDEEIKVDIPQGADIVTTKELEQYQGFENGIWTINSDILKKVIKDEKGNCYRIVKMEYDFLVKHALPLPQLHWLDRIKLGFQFK